jgi:hypothetical protein
MSEERLNTELAAIEAALCSLAPAPSNIQRDRLMFLAGKASARHRASRLLWPLTTVASLFLATTFAVLWAKGGNERLTESPIGVRTAASPIIDDIPCDAAPPSPWSNRRLCQLVLEKGVDAMPESSVYGNSVAPYVPRDDSYRGLMRQFLNNPAG